MAYATPAEDRPRLRSLARARAAIDGCRACPLWESATQGVPGEGPSDARLMLVGEQPGDREDLAGHPFVGPAGRLLDRALADAGIDRATVYLTNAVKHFKHERRGTRRLHKRPATGEVRACHWWLAQELAVVRPTLVVALGATALESLAGRAGRVGDLRGRPRPLDAGATLWVTVHPSFLLRVPEARRAGEYDAFVADLAGARDWLAAHG
jgi:DNA polymerase